ncbi:hypothetical protein OK074_2227 [Actinobacteria bacterium OK074]|nr:hypothetical protein OK074_2227 [Actinobacteria bacterium OK074]
MRRLCGELAAELTLPAPARPADLFAALCAGMSRRRGRPVLFRMAAFPPGTASGLWLDMADRDLVVVEERTTPEHQLVILGHELWHMNAGHGSRHGEDTTVASRVLGEDREVADLGTTVQRVATRTHSDRGEEEEAESFGLLLASRCRTWLTPETHAERDGVAGRIEASLEYRGRRH